MTSDIHHDEQGKELSRSDTEKRRLEHQAARVFLRCYEAEFDIPMRHIWHNEPAKPDTSCYCRNERLDLEIAHLYANESEAQLACGRQTEDPLWRYLSDLSGLDVRQASDDRSDAFTAQESDTSLPFTACLAGDPKRQPTLAPRGYRGCHPAVTAARFDPADDAF